jgi:TonB family protein
VSSDQRLGQAQSYIGRALFLRGFYAGSDLDFDSAGHAKGTPKIVDWTLAGMDLDSVSQYKPGELELKGTRVAIRYNPDAHTFDRHPLKTDHIRLRLAEPEDANGVKAALQAIFSTGIDPEMQRSMPDLWKHYFLPALDWQPDALAGIPILRGRPPADVTAPEPTKRAQPDYTPAARQDKVTGAVTLRCVVSPAGAAERIAILRPLGYGLDLQAAESLKRWRFIPATRAGLPVAAELTVEQQFELISPPR